MVSKLVFFLVMCIIVLTGISKVRSRPFDDHEAVAESCYYEGESYPIGKFLPQEGCTMSCYCNGYGPPSPCFPMCQSLPEPTCEVGQELYSYYEDNEYGCPCEMKACRELSDH